MQEEIYPNLYRLKIPLPESPLKYLNSYVIKGGARNLVVDTGLNRDVCKSAMMEGLKALNVSLDTLDIFITHLHADHFGLLSELVTENTKIYFNRPDAEIIEHWQGFEPMIQYGARSGFPEEILRSALHQHPGFKYGSRWTPSLNILNDDDVLEIGGYRFSCIQTPGHTHGHMCLHEPSARFLIAGDHLLSDITPNIQCWWEDGDPLGDYISSLDKIYHLKVDRVLPGHRRLFENYTERIDELKHHHEHRLEEILRLLEKKSPITAFETASQMTWDIEADSWDTFPVAQKWFATGEAISHLRYLERRGKIRRQSEDPVITFGLV
ncbi:MAG: MBL fold metallo-hydrolase [Desulfobacterales bacterium]|jgi:glyoxylase-like metal-dependent hydrolase (beta-lactamase superfamily II)|nr:MBL fold metallo-hydrolase [Desulfobacterales bacterium]